MTCTTCGGAETLQMLVGGAGVCLALFTVIYKGLALRSRLRDRAAVKGVEVIE